MRTLLVVLCLLLFGHVWAQDVLKPCGADYISLRIEDNILDGYSPVLLTDEDERIVGLMSVEPHREKAYPYSARNVEFNELVLCGSLEVSSFYYVDDELANILEWKAGRSIEISQDEGLLVIDALEVKKDIFEGIKAKVQFKTYDVFSEEEEIEAQKDHPDFLEDWGAPKGKGVFYYHLPSNWIVEL